MSLTEKTRKLHALLTEMGSVAIAFSGGVDSTFLLQQACTVLGPQQVLALTATSPTHPLHEQQESQRLASELGVRQLLIASNELEIPAFTENQPDRCYHCKKELFSLCRNAAVEHGYAEILDGSNSDDLADYRPGRRAGDELGVRSPLLEAGLNKEEIRTLSHAAGLSTWDKPPFACLSSRFPYGTAITAGRLAQLDRCENALRELGLRTYRVRFHDEVARIEVAPDEIARFADAELRTAVVAACKAAGFTYVALDLQGYRSGSMNEPLSPSAL